MNLCRAAFGFPALAMHLGCTVPNALYCSAEEMSACTGTSPVCGDDHSCHACTQHSQCTSNVCLLDGSCGDDTTVAFVAPGAAATSSDCTSSMPCQTITAALAVHKRYIKVAGGDVIETGTVMPTIDTVIFADPGVSSLTSSGSGPVISAVSGADLQIYDLVIAPAAASTMAVNIQGSSTVELSRATIIGTQGIGVSVNGGSLTLSQCRVFKNAGGGVSLTQATFDITNSMIAANGSSTAMFGGISISQPLPGTHRIEFDTITANTSMSLPAGISCGTELLSIAFENDIAYGNGSGAQLGDGCASVMYSDIGPAGVGGTGNIDADPMFADPAANDYHLTAGSPCRSVADPAATSVSVDIDGEPRSEPADIGADEF